MVMSKWWKCDLQVATPAWNFSLPAAVAYNFSKKEDRDSFLDSYMEKLQEKGVEIVALADHNSHEWIDYAKAAGDRHGIIVFPGCEITTGTGADGLHLLIVGSREKTAEDFKLLLRGELGFNEAHPRFLDDGSPGSSSKQILQILDDLPDEYLVIAPHAFNDNGIASANSVKGDIRYRALHHNRLSAIDVGDVGTANDGSWKSRFHKRELNDFPCMRYLPYIATSDAYKLDDLGKRFTWIRMSEPSIEGLRQAFLDFESRIISSWDSRLSHYDEDNPNKIQHAWIGSISVDSGATNTNKEIQLKFSPCLNVLVGGRGSGKSTIIAALRSCYSTTESLPATIRQEAVTFSNDVLGLSTITSTHYLRSSEEHQVASWSLFDGKKTRADGEEFKTTFKVRVVNQKELFDRVARYRHDENAVSRSLLSFVDESLGLIGKGSGELDTWIEEFDEAREEYTRNIKDYLNYKSRAEAKDSLEVRIKEIEKQLESFDIKGSTKRQKELNKSRKEELYITEEFDSYESWVESIKSLIDELEIGDPMSLGDEEIMDGFSQAIDGLGKSSSEIKAGLKKLVKKATKDKKDLEGSLTKSEWYKHILELKKEEQEYKQELETKGLNPKDYEKLVSELDEVRKRQNTATKSEGQLKESKEKVNASGEVITTLLSKRYEKRKSLLEEASSSSGKIKFSFSRFRDATGWGERIRDLLNIRADAFVEDVPLTSNWLFSDEDEMEGRIKIWKKMLLSRNFSEISAEIPRVKKNWWEKLVNLDESLRYRLMTEYADDLVYMSFLREGANPAKDDSWEDIKQGSPGQRSAAMLGFVLSYGSEPLVLDQPEDDLDTALITELIVNSLRAMRWKRQIIVATHNANIPVNGDAENIAVMENSGGNIGVRESDIQGVHHVHIGAIEETPIRKDIQNIMEGGVTAFVKRERRYNNEIKEITK